LWLPGRKLSEYTLHIDVPPSLQGALQGPAGHHLADIMAATRTSVKLGVGAPSTVTINGSRATIKEAYVVLQGHLPLVLMFDLDVTASLLLSRIAQRKRGGNVWLGRGL